MRSVLSLAAVSCLAVASSAQAAVPYYFLSFSPSGDGATENRHVRGVAFFVLDETTGGTTAFAAFQKLEPNTTYGLVYGNNRDNSTEPSQAFTTDSKGRGAFLLTSLVPVDPTDPNGIFLVYRDLNQSNSFDPEEIRASGNQFP
jgi:hypothetical protein